MTIHDWWLVHQNHRHVNHIIQDVTGCSIVNDYELAPKEVARLDQIIQQLKAGVPLAYALGHQPFLDCHIKVNNHVLIPRPATEEAVAHMIETMPEKGVFLDMCTGSGCVAIAVKKARPGWLVYAIDMSPDALATARSNAVHNGTEINFLLWDIRFHQPDNMPKEWDVIFANPPYVSEFDYQQEASLKYEPKIALVPSGEPTILYNNICRFARDQLFKDGALWFEFGHNQRKEVEKIVNSVGLQIKSCYADMQGFDRIMHCTTSS